MKNPLFSILVGKRCANFWLFLLILIPNLIAAFLEGASFGMILLSLALLNGDKIANHSAYPFLAKMPLWDWFEKMSPHEHFVLFIALAIVLQAVRSLANFFGQYITILLTVRVQTHAQAEVYKQIFRLSFPSVSRYKVGDLVEYARIPTTLVNVLMDAFNRFLVSFFMIGVSIVAMWMLSASLTLFTLALFSIVGFSQRRIMQKMMTASTSLTEHMAELSRHTIQSLHGIRAIYTFAREKEILSKTLANLKEIAISTKKLIFWNNSISSLNEILGISLVGACLIVGSLLLKSEQSLLLPVLLTFITVTYRLTNRVQAMLSSIGALAGNIGPFYRLQEILSKENKEFVPLGGLLFPGFKEKIEFKDVSLTYLQDHLPAVLNINFALQKGQVVALVGSSGAGKSSIVDLALRLYEPSSGNIEIDGVPLNMYDVNSWRACLGVVSQDPLIFNDTIEENIRFGQTNASLDAVLNAAKASRAHEFILRLPNGYQTVVGERGYRLSGGERQRLSLARALVRRPEILILDEATSNLDSHSESSIQESLKSLQKNTTILVIAHRLSTIVSADQIIVLEKGRIIEQGNHQTLLSLNGRYAYLWELQSKAKSDMDYDPDSLDKNQFI